MTRFPGRTKWLHLGLAALLWLALAFSLGWYYTITYYGRASYPMPLPEALGAPVLYYSSLALSLQSLPIKLQALLWLIACPVAGFVWVYLLALTAPYFNGRVENLYEAFYLFARCALPLFLPAPYLTWRAGADYGGWSFHHALRVALREDHIEPWWWLNGLYLVLALACLAQHLYTYAQEFRLPFKPSFRHLATTMVVYVLLLTGLGTIASVLLRQSV